MSYNDAKKKYAKIGIDTEKVLKDLAKVSLSTVLSVIGQGLVGVFVVLGLLAAAVCILNKTTGNQSKDE